jgi:hypothetical protein
MLTTTHQESLVITWHVTARAKLSCMLATTHQESLVITWHITSHAPTYLARPQPRTKSRDPAVGASH